MKKQLLSIVTATAMTLTALPLTVNAAELDEYLNSSNEVIAEFFDGFSLSNEYETENATILIKPNNYFIRLYEQDYSTIMFYPSSKEDIYTISAAVKEYFPKAYYPAELYSEHENEIYFEKYGYFEVANVNASSEQIKKVCDEIVLKYEVDKIVLRKTDYSGGLYDIDNREDSIFIYSQLRDIYLYDECVLFSKDTENADEELILHTIMNTKTVWNPINKTTTTTAESVTTDTPVTKGNGDANNDGETNMADAVLIMQSLANPDKYGINGTDETHITAQGEFNGDMDGNGLTNADALKIQKRILKIEDDFDNAITTDFIVTEIEDNTILVKPTDSIGNYNIYRVSTSVIADGSTPKVNSVYKVTWNGETLETYPAQFGKIYDMRLA